MDRVEILHFSDILCVWAYVAQARMNELESTFGEQIEVRAHFVSFFGDAHGKLERGWSTRGGAAGYSAHVREICHRYGFEAIHERCWIESTPRSSISAHVYLRAIGAAEAAGVFASGAMARAAARTRAAFFEEARDISKRAVQREIAEDCGLDAAEIDARIESGEAYAALNDDLELVREHGVRMSPTLVFNEGRQTLNGNVGYRVIEANVRELLANKADLASWC